MGVEFNSVQQEINTEELFTAGRHFLGVGHSFIVYPQTLQTVKFAAAGGDGPAITARTKDGLVVNLDVSFNFKYARLHSPHAPTLLSLLLLRAQSSCLAQLHLPIMAG